MTHVTGAIYTHGVLKPLQRLDIPDQQRVRIIVQLINGATAGDRAAAVERFRGGINRMGFRSGGRLPPRDELHNRAGVGLPHPGRVPPWPESPSD
jgi:predicted DNA-binding antitoxin AbrB/MazE fold protein